MKIEILIDEGATDLEISVTCRQLTPRVEKILATLRMMNQQLTARKGDEIHLLDIARVIYIESVDRKCFIYTDEDIYESDFPLYELERQLAEYGFFRVSKSFLIHLQDIQSKNPRHHVERGTNYGFQTVCGGVEEKIGGAVNGGAGNHF